MEKILIILENRKNRQLLEDYLAQQNDLLLLKEDFSEEVDLIIVDGLGFKRAVDYIKKIKENTCPVFLPVLLITPKQDIKLYQNSLFKEIDELVVTPIERLELLARVKILLRARKLSLLLERETVIDPLTGLYNRLYILQQGQTELIRSRRYGYPLSLLMLDLDFFKKVNDTYGHTVGDKVLINTAKRILKSIRNIDIVARYGGEEFVVLLPHTNMSGALKVAERIRTAIAVDPYVISSILSLHITVSIGTSTLTKEITEIKMLIDIADKALYEAKNKGKNIYIAASQ